MIKQKLRNELENVSALRENRMRVSKLVLQNEAYFLPLLEIVLDINDKTSIKAAWIFEFVCKEKLEWLFPHLDYYCSQINKLHFDSAVRPISKICKLLLLRNDKIKITTLNNTHKEQIIEVCFDWMISNQKVAVRAYTMQTLFVLGKEQPWVHEELILIIKKGIDTESSAYKSRGKITLLQIEKFNKKKLLN